MALQYGMNITASDMRSLLEKNDKQQSGIRTWRRLFGNASLGYNAQSDALTTDYSDAIAQAYRANFAQNNAIMNAGLGTGMTREMLAQSRNDLHTAYETYIRNYGSDMTKASENYGKEVGAIDAALTERATNFANLYNSAYKYLAEELYGSTLTLPGTAENGATPIYEGKGKKSKLVGYENVTLDYFDENDLGWLKNDAGELLSWNELSHSLMNPDGSLTAKGVKFFDQMFNTLPENYMSTNDEGETWRTRGFDEWLSATDNDLRNWWVSQDEFNYNFAGTNKGTANVLTGRESTDDKYGVYEYADTSGLNRSLPSTTSFDTSIGAYEDAVAGYLDAYKHYLSTPDSSVPNSPGADARNQVNTAKSAYDKAKENLSTSWLEYTEQIKTERNNALDFLQSKVGTEMYNEFLRENKAFVDSYADLLNVQVGSPILGDPKDIEAYGKNVVNQYRQAGVKLDKYYQELLTRIRAFIKKHGYDGKMSGF
jgi:hypothetical protein